MKYPIPWNRHYCVLLDVGFLCSPLSGPKTRSNEPSRFFSSSHPPPYPTPTFHPTVSSVVPCAGYAIHFTGISIFRFSVDFCFKNKNHRKKITVLKHHQYWGSSKSFGKQLLTSWFAGVHFLHFQSSKASYLHLALCRGMCEGKGVPRLSKTRFRDLNLTLLNEIPLLYFRFRIFRKQECFFDPWHQWCSWPVIGRWYIRLHKAKQWLKSYTKLSNPKHWLAQ